MSGLYLDDYVRKWNRITAKYGEDAAATAFDDLDRNTLQWISESIPAVWEFYWNSDVPVREIAEAYRIRLISQVGVVAGPCFFDDVRCERCQEPIDFRSKAEFKATFSGYKYALKRTRCSSCQKVDEDAREERYRRERDLREARLLALRSMPYRDYLQTQEWAARRAAALKRARHRCQTCGGDGLLNVHHRTYARRGNELNADITVLCRPCHALFHGNATLAERGRADA